MRPPMSSDSEDDDYDGFSFGDEFEKVSKKRNNFFNFVCLIRSTMQFFLAKNINVLSIVAFHRNIRNIVIIYN